MIHQPIKMALDSVRKSIEQAQHEYGAAPRTDIDEAFKCLCDAVVDLTEAVEGLYEAAAIEESQR